MFSIQYTIVWFVCDIFVTTWFVFVILRLSHCCLMIPTSTFGWRKRRLVSSHRTYYVTNSFPKTHDAKSDFNSVINTPYVASNWNSSTIVEILSPVNVSKQTPWLVRVCQTWQITSFIVVCRGPEVGIQFSVFQFSHTRV